MTQQLILDEHRGTDTASLIESDQPHAPPANDLRHAMMTLPVERQNVMLAEYAARRNNFRNWLQTQMEQGVHYGVPPGCEPKKTNPAQWQSQPSLYAAGADLLCDLLGLRAEFAFDTDAWVQFGSKPGYLVVVCRLYSRATKECIGEGRGARKEGQKGGDANNAVKMAQKCAKVDAILNAYGLRDVFTQDLEIPTQPLHDNPEPSPEAPQERTRGKRQPTPTAVTIQQLNHVKGEWAAKNPEPFGDLEKQKAKFAEWVRRVTERTKDFNPIKVAEWAMEDYHACCEDLKIPTLEDLQRDGAN